MAIAEDGVGARVRRADAASAVAGHRRLNRKGPSVTGRREIRATGQPSPAVAASSVRLETMGALAGPVPPVGPL